MFLVEVWKHNVPLFFEQLACYTWIASLRLDVTPASFSPNLIRRRLGKLAAHIVVALIALVVIGGATRVMEAGLACPDWPLCFGSLLQIGEMNTKVFLEWFHRLDAFFVGIAISIQLTLSLFFKSYLPKWLPWFYGLIFFLLLLHFLITD